MGLEARVARSLEAGRGGAVSRALADVWARAARVERRLTVPDSVVVVAVGGATLGGSGKTPLAMAVAREVAAQGEPVALVGHAYRAHPSHACVVTGDDAVEHVGDEALACARALPATIPVVVAPTRQRAIDHAATMARVLVLDGVSQLSPRRADLALLALDADRPWGAGACPPCGDLRAPRGALLAACDRVVCIGDDETEGVGLGPPVDTACPRSEGAWLGSAFLPWDELRGRRVGVLCTIARPERLLRSLAQEGVVPVVTVVEADHATPGRTALGRASGRGRAAGVNIWLATSKCATKLGPYLGGMPVATLQHELALSASLRQALRNAVARLTLKTARL